MYYVAGGFDSWAQIFKFLKVDGNEKRGGQEGDSKSASVWHCGDRGLF